MSKHLNCTNDQEYDFVGDDDNDDDDNDSDDDDINIYKNCTCAVPKTTIRKVT